MKKKIIYGAGSVLAISAPIAGVVACSSSESAEKTKEVTTTSKWTKEIKEDLIGVPSFPLNIWEGPNNTFIQAPTIKDGENYHISIYESIAPTSFDKPNREGSTSIVTWSSKIINVWYVTEAYGKVYMQLNITQDQIYANVAQNFLSSFILVDSLPWGVKNSLNKQPISDRENEMLATIANDLQRAYDGEPYDPNIGGN